MFKRNCLKLKLIIEQLTESMKKINFKTFFSILVVIASACSFTFLNNVDKVSQPLVDVKNEVIKEKQEMEAQVSEVGVFLPDVSILGKAAKFVEENLPAD